MAGGKELAAHVVIDKLLVDAVQAELGTGFGAEEMGVPVIDDQPLGRGFFGNDGGNLVAG